MSLKRENFNFQLTALNFGISFIASYTLANCNMMCSITQRIYTTWFLLACNNTRSCLRTAIFVIGAIIIIGAAWCLGNWFDCTTSVWRYSVAILSRTHATATLINDKSAFKCAYTPAIFIDLQSFFNSTWNAIAVNIDCRARWTHTVSVNISYKSFVFRTRRNCNRTY